MTVHGQLGITAILYVWRAKGDKEGWEEDVGSWRERSRLSTYWN
jgi:hypothetical protein